jgi:hypothetical protein
MIIGKVDEHRLLGLGIQLLPLIKAIGRYDAAAAIEGLAEHAGGGDGLGPCVDRLDLGQFLGPRGDQAPPGEGEGSLAAVAEADHRHRLAGGDVEHRLLRQGLEQFIGLGIEGLGQQVGPADGVAATHEQMIGAAGVG